MIYYSCSISSSVAQVYTMVYEKVMLIAGKVLTREEAEEYVDEEGYVNFPYTQYIHTYRCCSNLQGQKYIVGLVMHTFYRKKLKSCGKPLQPGSESKDEVIEEEVNELTPFRICGKYYSCDRCLGTCTTGGRDYSFDVDKILNTVVEYDASLVCSNCYDIDCNEGDICKTCNHKKHRETTRGPLGSISAEFGFKFDDQKFYLMIDDCLSCS